jgi:hypothetical protein
MWMLPTMMRTVVVLFVLLMLFPESASAQGKACSSDRICSRGMTCDNGECVPVDTDRSCTPGTSQACFEGAGRAEFVGECHNGTRYCQTDGRYGACLAQVLPTPEQCDQLDNDCDGQIDEGLTCECQPGAQRACYPFASGTLDVGECSAGVQHCTMGHRWDTCRDDRGPSADECDGLDNDCDGQTDEQCQCLAGAIRSCYGFDQVTAGVGECGRGSQVCGRDNTWSQCFDDVGPAPEVCDSLDNNCDGTIDDGCLVPDTRMLETPVVVEPVSGFGR